MKYSEDFKFKPCPFCGRYPRYLAFKAGYYSERVICDNCGIYLAPEDWEYRVLEDTNEE